MRDRNQQNNNTAKPPAIAHGASLPKDFDLSISLPDVLQKAAQGKTGIAYIQPDGSKIFQSYAELLGASSRILGGLRASGLKPQNIAILQISRHQDFLVAFWGCLLGGIVPVPIGDRTANLRDRVWQLCDRPLMITDNRETLLEAQTVAIEDLKQNSPDRNYHRSQPDDLALLLMTSGSTGMPKGVMLTARNLLVSAYGMASVNQLTREDITLNWMPLEHAASLVMFHLTEVYLGCQQIHVANEIILQNPLKWLEYCDRDRVTATWAPNFAYGLINDCADKIQQQQWDLSCLRWMGNGAETVVGKTTKRFLELLAPYGLANTSVSPGYGMSETCSGIVHSHRVLTGDEPFVEVGSPIPGVSLRIVDDENQVVTEGTIGLLQVKGLTVTSGYYKNCDRDSFSDDGWFNTGDLGFLQEGRLTITGRQKEVIIINGVNYYNHEIEAVIEELDGVEVSYTAACAVRGSEDTTDKLAIFFTPSRFEGEFLDELAKKIRKILASQIGIYANYLIPVEREVIPKTAIGKIQRQQLSRRFESGEFQSLRTTTSELPRNDLERCIADIWQQVLGIERVSLQDNFFELGGNSVLLMQVLARLQDLGQQLSAVELFQYPTIATLAQYLSREQGEVSAVQKGQQRAQQRRKNEHTDIAVIGMSCRFPGAKNIDEFWQNLCDGVESISFFSDEEILATGIEPELLKNPHYVKASPILDDIELFDAEFFGYSPKEAELIDPQQRLLLECAWEGLENAGYDPFNYDGAIALYAGASANTYLLNNVYPNRDRIDEYDNLQVVNLGSIAGFQMTVANDKDYLTTRVSYKLNLTGASVNVQTACSTSLVAIHMAAQSLIAGECDMAMAGGVSVHVPQKIGYLYREGTILSPDGHCRAFDAGAQGTLFGSGAGIVVLKRLDEAVKDGDRIYAVIKGSAINNDGGNKVGYFAPNSDGQAKAIAEAIAMAGIDADAISYVEAHGTGTLLGDPIELRALSEAFGYFTNKKGFCAIGSVKTNVGHLNIASGVAGFIKAVLGLYLGKIPPSLHFERGNPQVDFESSPFFVNTGLRDWEGGPLAGVNSLGIGGTNVFVVLEGLEKPHAKTQRRKEGYYLLTLSGKSEEALHDLVGRYERFLAENSEISLGDVCFTAHTGRSHFDFRVCILTDSSDRLREQLRGYLEGKKVDGLVGGRVLDERFQPIVFSFSGEGLYDVDAGREFYLSQSTFRDTLDKCAKFLNGYSDKPLFDILFTQLSPPALFAIEYALYELWQSWGIEPSTVIGDGVGEYVAACVAGVFSLEDALKLIAAKEGLMKEDYKTVARQVAYSVPRIEFISSETGDVLNDEIATPEYWCREIGKCEPKHLEDSVFVEIGSKSISWQHLLNNLAYLYIRGIAIDWVGFDRDYSRRRVTLPTYPFQRKRYWIEPKPQFSTQTPTPTPPLLKGGQGGITHPLLGQKLRSPLKEILFQSQSMPAFLKDHRIFERVVFPGTAYLEMALATVKTIFNSPDFNLENVTIHQPLILLEEDCPTVQLIFNKETTEFQIYSLASEDDESWQLHCSGNIILTERDIPSEKLDRDRFLQELSVEEHYQRCRKLGIDYGASFVAISQLWQENKEALGLIRMPELLASQASSYILHPALLDACCQVIFAAFPETLQAETYLPVGLERLSLYRRPTGTLWSRVCLRSFDSPNPETILADVHLFDESGQSLARIDGLCSKKASRATVLRSVLKDNAIAVVPSELSNGDRKSMAIETIQSYLSELLGIYPPEAIDVERGLMELGMDSLAAIELREKLEATWQCTLPSTLVFDYPSISAIADYLEEKIFTATVSQLEDTTTNLDPIAAEIQSLSETEAELMLLDELDKIIRHP